MHLALLHPRSRSVPSGRRLLRGIGLIELMVALALGLFLIGGVISIFASNRQAFRATEQLTRMQDSARVAFELMARSLREAGGTGCGRGLPVANVIDSASSHWWADWDSGLRGYGGTDNAGAVSFGTASGQRISGTHAFFSIHADGNTGAAISNHDPASSAFTLVNNQHGLQAGQIAMACDYRRAAIFQVTNATGSSVSHAASGATPGNCYASLGHGCSGAAATYTFQPGGVVNAVVSETWYVGANSRNRRSLFRARLTRSGSTATTQVEEIAEGVQNMQIAYLETSASGTLPDSYGAAASVTDWSRVVAARITLTLRSNEAVGTDGANLEREATHIVSLRNRLP